MAPFLALPTYREKATDRSTPKSYGHSTKQAGLSMKKAGQLRVNSLSKRFVKGKGNGKGCHNCGDLNHYIRDCPKPRKGKGKGKGCHNCGGLNHYIGDCPTNLSRGKVKGKRKGNKLRWQRRLGANLTVSKRHQVVVLS